MTPTSNTYDFAPSVAEVGLNAFSRIGIKGPDLTAEHMRQLGVEANLMQASWSNRGPNLWTVDDIQINLEAGRSTYDVPPETVTILDAYLSTGGAGGDFGADTGPDALHGGIVNDRPVLPISRSEWAAYPDKTTPGPPTVYWFDRLRAPTITLWPVPDAASNYMLRFHRYRQIQDARLAGGFVAEIPYLWFDAYAAGLAHRLARHYARDLEAVRKTDADEAWGIAANQNVEDAPFYISPMLSGYFR